MCLLLLLYLRTILFKPLTSTENLRNAAKCRKKQPAVRTFTATHFSSHFSCDAASQFAGEILRRLICMEIGDSSAEQERHVGSRVHSLVPFFCQSSLSSIRCIAWRQLALHCIQGTYYSTDTILLRIRRGEHFTSCVECDSDIPRLLRADLIKKAVCREHRP